MIAELGHYALVLALGLALVQASVPIWGARTRDPALMAVGTSTALAQFAQRLSAEGQRVGLITNDQGSHLVDTEVVRNLGLAP